MAQASLRKAQQEGGSVRLVTKELFFPQRSAAASPPASHRWVQSYGTFLLLLFNTKLGIVVFIPPEDKVSPSIYHVGLCHNMDFLFWIWCICLFLPSAVSMEMHICLVGEPQRPAECVGTVNIDPNTIYWVRYIGQFTAGGSITMETCSKHGSSCCSICSNLWFMQNASDGPLALFLCVSLNKETHLLLFFLF